MYISIDVGGTSTRVASSKDLTSIYKIEKFPTDHDFEAQKVLMKEAVSSVCDGDPVEAASFGVPGFVDKKKPDAWFYN